MRILHDWRGLPAEDRGAAVAFGNFDGVHRGHQQVIAMAVREARRLGVPAGVVSFEPHPRTIFQPDAPSFRLMKTDQQVRALEALAIDVFYIVPFDQELAQMTDRQFAERVLHEGLGVKHVAVGFDVSFGRGRSGSPQAMEQYGREFGFGVSVADPQADTQGVKFSSTLVRDALREGRPQVAAAILGRPFAIEGPVRRGRQLGRKFGYPTANVALDDYVQPRLGVYATRTRLPDGREFAGVANVGANPTVGRVDPRLEVWLFDFDEDIYGQVIETDLIAFLRPEATFDTVDEMNSQVMRDAEQAKRLLDVSKD